MCGSPIVLDLDGVIVKSNIAKHDAMLSLFEGHPEKRNQVSSYILANGGVRRDHKLRHILTKIFEVKLAEDTLSSYLFEYAHKLESLLAAAPLVEGVEDFLANRDHSFNFYVSSSAPEAEVKDQLSRRGLAGHFKAVFSANTPKEIALRQVSSRHPGQITVFFGDSVGDWNAAREAGVAFVAVISERDNFAGLPVTKLSDFMSIPAVLSAINAALSEQAT
jgi:phosphoglycolate phosphatase-like HAD superfamily hydrolase